MGTPAIDTWQLTRRYGPVLAVDALSFHVEPGEVFGLVGPNGGGKTTVVKMLTTLLPPTSGSARVAGFDVVHQAMDVRRSIGYVPQMPSVDGALTGFENLLITAKLYGVPRAEREPRIQESLARNGLADAASRLAREYSGGMLRRLEIAQATLHRPHILFLDEPTVGLDPVARESVWEHVLALRRSFGTVIFVTTHYMDEADRLCDRVAIIHRGRILAVGAPAELKAPVPGADVTLEDVFIYYTGDAGSPAERSSVPEMAPARGGRR